MPNNNNKFILTVALQVAVIFAIVIFKVSVLAGGTEVLLRIKPVDPRDFLRGDYVTFRYDISDINGYSFGNFNGGRATNGQTVYVVLTESGKYSVVSRVLPYKPTDGSLFIKGVVQSGGAESASQPWSISGGQIADPFSGGAVHVVYGAEEYFIPEGVGRNMSFWNKEAAAALAVDEDGNPVLKKIYIDDKPWP